MCHTGARCVPVDCCVGLEKSVHHHRRVLFRSWENELENDFDKTFLLNGIEFGFDIAN
jgi:hypothetical protein